MVSAERQISNRCVQSIPSPGQRNTECPAQTQPKILTAAGLKRLVSTQQTVPSPLPKRWVAGLFTIVCRLSCAHLPLFLI
ncbi:hypothetical protein CLOSTMETH_00917 [[Clostridium] methylpentosum DSM 5476]|uniref:Uncharacterized protein n=1 Tax=[Clostridium] methylpentosum DSM 5476 TaxID=537013 RepID=C0EAQ3_9FIRM|nr:hypothetical protein CLOSTMETH_00917 [[Clostridium] methylpentosum DSM 5476]